MDNKLVVISIAAVIGIIVLGSVLMPILDDATATTDTFTNEGIPYAIPDDGSHTIIVGKSGDAITITVDGESATVPNLTLYGSATIIYAESSFVRLMDDGKVMVYGKTNATDYANLNCGNASDGVTFTITGTTAAVTVSAVDYTVPDIMAFISSTGSYSLTTTPYVSDDSVIIGAGLSTSGGTTGALLFYGTIDDITAKGLWPSGRIAKLNTINMTTDNSHIDLYEISSVVLDWGDGVYDKTATYTYFLAPHEVTAERSVHFTDGQNAIFAAIPVMIILAVLLGVVALVIRSRMD